MPQNGITLPPTVVTPDPQLPIPPAPFPGDGVFFRPLPWDGKFPANSEIDAFFNKKILGLSISLCR